MSIEIEHLGSVRDVTGSCHYLNQNGVHILVDCGITQGKARRTNMHQWPVQPSEIDYLFVTHAHIDHIGRIPELIRKGFQGEILTTHATKLLIGPMIENAMVLGNQTKREQKRMLAKIDELTWGFEYNEVFGLTKNISFKLGRAGHILGSCFVQIQTQNDAIVFSGDLGLSDSPILCKPDTPDACTILCLESTYGNTIHDCRNDSAIQLGKILTHAIADQGKVYIPAFVLGRTYELIYEINRLFTDSELKKQFPEIKRIPIFLDTPLGISITRLFSKLSKYWNKEAKQSIGCSKNPIDFSNLYTVENYQQHLKLLDMPGPLIIFAGSSMCTGGRILNHLKAGLPDWRNEIIFVGWQTPGTLGNEIIRFSKRAGGYIFIDNERVDIKANTHILSGYSAHADQTELVQWVNGIPRKPKLIKLVHGEIEAQNALKNRLQSFGYQVQSCT